MKRFVILLLMINLTLFTISLSMDQAHAQDPSNPYGNKGFLLILYPLKDTTLSAEVAGKIKRISYDMGETFKKGDVLITLDSDYFHSEKEKAAANAAYSAAVYQLKKELYDQKSVSTVEYIKAQAEHDISKASLAIARKNLAVCSVRAPYDGKVVKRLSRENEFVAKGQPLLDIIDDRIIRVKFHLPSLLYSAIEVGQIYRIKINDIPSEFESKITHISPIVESNTSSFQVFAQIDNAENKIRAGMTGYIRIEVKRDDL
ncbi:MAG: efflux RND transporter periplasmic adaptor subunit [Desulfatitalea sp.]|nr:efflux RND transporter periplasmic adaptor subunit [Desulfatitalea sp.]NNK02575.1 efflux RND transporter periplasmic adaptor subunit [Desulfatitalea sp.]